NITIMVDKKSAEAKFMEIDKMNVFTAAIVPPNGSEDILDDMDEIIDELQEANIKEYKHELKSDVRDPIKKTSKIVSVLRQVAEYGRASCRERRKILVRADKTSREKKDNRQA